MIAVPPINSGRCFGGNLSPAIGGLMHFAFTRSTGRCTAIIASRDFARLLSFFALPCGLWIFCSRSCRLPRLDPGSEIAVLPAIRKFRQGRPRTRDPRRRPPKQISPRQLGAVSPDPRQLRSRLFSRAQVHSFRDCTLPNSKDRATESPAFHCQALPISKPLKTGRIHPENPGSKPTQACYSKNRG